MITKCVFFIFFSIFLVIYDIKKLILPDYLLISLFLTLFFCDIIIKPNLILYNILSSFLGGTFFLFIYFITKKGIGLGDVKFSIVIGYFLGIKLWIFSILVSCFSAIFFYLLTMKLFKWNKNTKIPFGPFLAVSSIIVYIWGNII